MDFLLYSPSRTSSLTMGSPGLGLPSPSRSTQTSSLPSLPHFLLLTVWTLRGGRERPGRRSFEYLLVREERQAGGRLAGRAAGRERRARSWPCLEGWRRTPDTGLVWGPSLRVRLEVGPPRRQGAGHSAVRGERRKAGQGGPEHLAAPAEAQWKVRPDG